MSDTRSIAAVTVTLRHMIQEALVGMGANVSVTRPGTGGNGAPSPSVNLFLYQASPNAAWRNEDLPTRRADGRLLRKPQAALDLHYLLSFYGDDTALEPQRLLGRVTRTLHAKPVLSRTMVATALADPDLVNTDIPDSDLPDAVELVRVSPSALSLEELSKLWSIFFQTPYALSVAYQASVVLVEDDSEEPEPGLPVSRRNVYALPFRQPVVERVEAVTGPLAPIASDTILRVSGSRLRGQVTHVRVGDAPPIAPQSVEDTELTVDLASIPATDRRAGVTGLQVIHDVLIGTPEKAHRGVESNVVAFVLRPTLTDVDATDPQATVTVKTVPPVRAGQRLTLLLNERSADGSGSYSFERDPLDVDASSIEFAISSVEPGDYFVRLRVDGAESPLEVEDDENDPAFGQFIGPEVQIP